MTAFPLLMKPRGFRKGIVSTGETLIISGFSSIYWQLNQVLRVSILLQFLAASENAYFEANISILRPKKVSKRLFKEHLTYRALRLRSKLLLSDLGVLNVRKSWHQVSVPVLFLAFSNFRLHFGAKTTIWLGWCCPCSINSNSKTNSALRMCFRLKPVHSKEVSPASAMSN